MTLRSRLLGFRAAGRCRDCSACTHALREYYMVTDDVWYRQARMPARGQLCIGCLERRLGRRLKPRDFTPYPVNFASPWPQSKRLLARLGLAWR